MDIDSKTFHKMKFIYNAINNGWKVKKRKGKYIFTKAHRNKTEVFHDDYLEKFVNTSLSI